MRNYILADNQELTRFALESLLQKEEGNVIYRAFDKARLVELLKEHESAVVLLDYTLFDFTDEDQLLIIGERFSLSQWILISDELTPQFLRRVVYSSHQFSVVFKDGDRDGDRDCEGHRPGQDHEGDCCRALLKRSHRDHPPQKYLPQTGYQHSPRSGKIRAPCGVDRSIRILYLK